MVGGRKFFGGVLEPTLSAEQVGLVQAAVRSSTASAPTATCTRGPSSAPARRKRHQRGQGQSVGCEFYTVMVIGTVEVLNL